MKARVLPALAGAALLLLALAGCATSDEGGSGAPADATAPATPMSAAEILAALEAGEAVDFDVSLGARVGDPTTRFFLGIVDGVAVAYLCDPGAATFWFTGPVDDDGGELATRDELSQAIVADLATTAPVTSFAGAALEQLPELDVLPVNGDPALFIARSVDGAGNVSGVIYDSEGASGTVSMTVPTESGDVPLATGVELVGDELAIVNATATSPSGAAVPMPSEALAAVNAFAKGQAAMREHSVAGIRAIADGITSLDLVRAWAGSLQ